MNLTSWVLDFGVTCEFLDLPRDSGPQKMKEDKAGVDPHSVLESPVACSLGNGRPALFIPPSAVLFSA